MGFLDLFKSQDREKLKEGMHIDELIKALENEDWNVQWEAAKALEKIGTLAVEQLIATLNKNKKARGMAAGVLGLIGDTRAVEPLIALLNDKDSSGRAGIVEALGRMRDARAIEPLSITLRTDKDGIVRREAAKALGLIGEPALESLISALKHESPGTRQAVAIVLGDIGDVKAVEPLIAALKSGDVGWAAAEALGKIRDTRAVEPLMAALEDKDSDLQQAARKALAKINKI